MAGPLPEFREGRRRQVWQLLSGWDVANHAKARVFLQKHIIIAQPLTQWGTRICEGEIDIAEDESVIVSVGSVLPAESNCKLNLALDCKHMRCVEFKHALPRSH